MIFKLKPRGTTGYVKCIFAIFLLLLVWKLGSKIMFAPPTDIEELDHTDKSLHHYIWDNHIISPSGLDYNFEGINLNLGYIDDSDIIIRSSFKNKIGGFFVEIGSFKPGTHSHTLILEKDYNWNGLLIECKSHLVEKLKSVNRKAYIAGVCISPIYSRPIKTLGRRLRGNLDNTNSGTYKFPIFAIFASIDVYVVDVFVLGGQSRALEVLEVFPFDLVLVKVWLIQVLSLTANHKDWLINYMEINDYPSQRVIKTKNEVNMIFFHNSFP